MKLSERFDIWTDLGVFEGRQPRGDPRRIVNSNGRQAGSPMRGGAQPCGVVMPRNVSSRSLADGWPAWTMLNRSAAPAASVDTAETRVSKPAPNGRRLDIASSATAPAVAAAPPIVIPDEEPSSSGLAADPEVIRYIASITSSTRPLPMLMVDSVSRSACDSPVAEAARLTAAAPVLIALAMNKPPRNGLFDHTGILVVPISTPVYPPNPSPIGSSAAATG